MFKRVFGFITLLSFSSQAALAGDANYKQTHKRALNKTAYLVVDTIVANAHERVLQYIKSPEKLRDEISAEFKNEQINKTLASQNELIKKIKVEKEGLNLIFKTENADFRVSFEKIFDKKLVINGNVIGLEKLKSKADFMKLLERHALPQSSAGFFSFIIPEAHAIPILAIVVVAILAALGVDFWAFLDNLTGINEKKEKFKALQDKMKNAIAQCESDLENVKSMRRSSIISNQTTEFMEYLEEYSYNNWKEPDLVSCGSLKKVDGLLAKTPIFRMELYSKVEQMCALGSQLDACLQATENEIERKNIIVNDTRENKDEFPQASPYKEFIDNFGQAARGN